MDAETKKKLSSGYKKCCRCGRSKALGDFNYRRDTVDKLQYHCRVCNSKSMAEYYKKSTDEYRRRAKTRKDMIKAQTMGCSSFAEYAYGFYKTEAKLLYLQDGIKREVDHIQSIYDGGYHEIDNFQLLTKSENRQKGKGSWLPDDDRVTKNIAFQDVVKRRWRDEGRCNCEHCQAMFRDMDESRVRRRKRRRGKLGGQC